MATSRSDTFDISEHTVHRLGFGTTRTRKNAATAATNALQRDGSVT